MPEELSETAAAPPVIPAEEDLLALAGRTCAPAGNSLAAVGTPLCITSLDEGLLAVLEGEGYSILRALLSEMLWFLWKDNGKRADRGLMDRAAQALGASGACSPKPDSLFETADACLRAFAGGLGRYCYAKALELGGWSRLRSFLYYCRREA